MNHTHRIVVWDPKNEYWEGSLVEEQRARQLEARGVVSLPVAAEMFKHSGVGAFHKRSWGSGYPLDSMVPRMNAPLTLYVNGNYHHIYWAARLVRDTRVGIEQFAGSLRLTIDSGQPSALAGGFAGDETTNVDIGRLGAEDEHDGWTIRGSARLYATGEGYVGMALYGMGVGLRIAWAAVSLSP